MGDKQEIIFVEIENINDGMEYEVNGKLIYKDELGNWQSDNELSDIEKAAFKSYVKLIIRDTSQGDNNSAID